MGILIKRERWCCGHWVFGRVARVRSVHVDRAHHLKKAELLSDIGYGRMSRVVSYDYMNLGSNCT